MNYLNFPLQGLTTTPTTKRKVFISYHHKDQYYKNKFEELFGDIFINKSVSDGDINTDTSTEYIKRLIQSSDYLADASVCIVLVGPETYKRKHVDWEIYGALTDKVGGCSGLIGICLPNNNDFKKKNTEGNPIYTSDITPKRLVDNLISGYASYHDWTENKESIKKWIETAFKNKTELKNKRDLSSPQFIYNKE